MKEFKDIEWGKHPVIETGIKGMLDLENGYKLSVIAGGDFYCSPKAAGKTHEEYISFELAIVDKYNNIVGDVRGWQTRDDINNVISTYCDLVTIEDIYIRGQMDLINKIRSDVKEIQSRSTEFEVLKLEDQSLSKYDDDFNIEINLIKLVKELKPIMK